MTLPDSAPFEVFPKHVLGYGSLGMLCRGRIRSNGKDVAVRILPQDLREPEFARRFHQEILYLQAVSGGNILPVLGAGEYQGRLCFAQELAAGESLASQNVQSVRYNTEDILHVAEGVARSLSDGERWVSHHGRLRPSSIFIGPEGVIKVSDAGLTRLFPADPDSRWAGVVWNYLAPEQVERKLADIRGDLYSLGVILYEMAVGRTPFEGHQSSTSLIYQLLHADPKPPRDMGSLIPRELERLILRCLAKQPGQRIQSTREFLSDLENVRHALAGARNSQHPDQTDLGDFAIEEDQILGEGGMGTLYRGRQHSLGRPVAIKVIRPMFLQNPELVGRFKREAELLARVSHGNVVQIFGTGIWKGSFFYAMELVEGSDLSAMLDRGHVFSEGEILNVAHSVASALQAAWKYEIVHRDIKPSNILLTPDGRIKVADFGLAKSLRIGGPGESKVIMGTWEYLSPEQALGQPVDIRSDIYSLGIVLYEIATGKPPFTPSGSVTSILFHHVHTAPPVLPESLGISDEIRHLIIRCLAKKARNRFQNPDELLEAIDAIRAGLNGTSPSIPPFPVPEAAVGLKEDPPWKSDFALRMGLGDYAAAMRLAERRAGIRSKEFRRAQRLHDQCLVRDQEVKALERIRLQDWPGALTIYRQLLNQASETRKEELVVAIRYCTAMARARETLGRPRESGETSLSLEETKRRTGAAT